MDDEIPETPYRCQGSHDAGERCALCPIHHRRRRPGKAGTSVVEQQNILDVIDSLRKSKKSNIPKILTTSSNKTKQQPKEQPNVSTATLWQPFTEDEIKTMSLNDIKKNIANRWGCEGFKIYKNMKKVDIDIIRHNVLAADKVIRDFKIPNLISRFYYGGTDSDFMGTIPGHNKKPAIITFDAVAVKLNSMKSAYKGLLVKHDCPSSTNWMDVLSHEIGHAVEWYLVRKKYPNSAKEQINSWKKCDVSTEIVINAIKRYRFSSSLFFLRPAGCKQTIRNLYIVCIKSLYGHYIRNKPKNRLELSKW